MSQAAAYMKMNQFDEAEGFVQSAQEKDSSGVATLINTVSSFQYQGKTKEVQSQHQPNSLLTCTVL